MAERRVFVDRGITDRKGASREAVAAATTRRLAAILAADVAGYSRLMGADEESAHFLFAAIRHHAATIRAASHILL